MSFKESLKVILYSLLIRSKEDVDNSIVKFWSPILHGNYFDFSIF